MAISPQIISAGRVDTTPASGSTGKAQQSSSTSPGQDSFAQALEQRLQRAEDTADRRDAPPQSRADNAGRRTAESASSTDKPKPGATNAEQTSQATSTDAKAAKETDAKAAKDEAQVQTADDPSDNANGSAIDFVESQLETAEAGPSDAELVDPEGETAGFVLSGASSEPKSAQVDANLGLGGRRSPEGALTETQAPMTNWVKGAKVSSDVPSGQPTNGSLVTSAAVPSNADALAPMKLGNAEESFESAVKADLGKAFAKVVGAGLEPSPAHTHTPGLEGHTAASGVHQALQASLPGGGRVAIAIDVRFGSENWSAQVAERSAQLAFQNIQSAQLQLDPPELGPLSIKIHMHQDQAVVQFVTSNAQVKEALDGTMNRLRELLQEQGIDLLEADVRDESQSQGRERHAAADRNRDFGESLPGDAETAKTVIEVSSGIDYFV